MKIAYIILAHNDWDHLRLLINKLKEDWNDIFVHIDAKSNFDEATFLKSLSLKNRIYFTKFRKKVFWGHISIVHATLELMNLVAQHSIFYDRIILLSGQDFPIVPNRVIKKFFENNYNIEYLEYGKLPLRYWPYGGFDRVLIYNFPNIFNSFWNKFFRFTQMLLPFRREYIPNYDFYGCSQWFNITGQALKFILDQVNTTDILKRFNYTYCADEIFFQTILLNSSFSTFCVNNCLRHIEWSNSNSHPKILDLNDYYKLIDNVKKNFFARKFSTKISKELINVLTPHIL